MTKAIYAFRICLGLALALATLEVCARIDDVVAYGAPLWGSYAIERLWRTDENGRHGIPGQRYKDWQMNSLGFRGPELKPDGINIICIGASETFGEYEGPNQDFPRQLEQLLNAGRSKKDVQVINVALPNQRLWAATRQAADLAAKTHAQLAIIYPSPAMYITPLKPGRFATNDADSNDRFTWRLADRFMEFAKLALPDEVGNAVRNMIINRQARDLGPLIEKLPEDNVLLSKHDLVQLIQTLRSYKIRPVVVTHVTYFSGNDMSKFNERERSMLTHWRKFFPRLTEGGFMDMEDRINQVVRNVAKEEHVPLVDLTATFPHGPNYFYDFCHFRAAGAQIFASGIAKTVAPLLPASAASTTY